MVIDDVGNSQKREPTQNHSNKSDSSEHSSAFIASPVDRLAAFMADLVVFLPILTLCLAPIKKQVLLAQIAGDNEKLLILGFVGAGVVSLLLVVYQTLFIGLMGATPGKKFLGLKVVNIWNKTKPDFFSAFVRSSFWVLSLCTFGIPWLAIFSNSHRRPLHDRAADTLVLVPDRKRASSSPGMVETSMINGLNAAIITFTILVFSVIFQSYIHDNKHLADTIVNSSEASTQRCESVTSAIGGWLGTEKQAPGRTEIALALHAGERIDDECLESEVTMNFLEEKDLELSYLAKALIKQDDEEQFADYIEKVCEKDEKTSGCSLLEYLQAQKSDAIHITDDAPTYLRIWAVRLNLERGHPQEAIAQLKNPAPHMDLAYYYSMKRLQAQLELKRETDINQDFLASLDGLNREERISLSRETCLAETQMGCSGAKLSCQKLLEFSTSFKTEKELSFENPQSVLAIARAVRCENKPELYEKFQSAVEIPAGRALLQALELKSKGKIKDAMTMLKSLSRQKELSEFRVESLALLSELSQKPAELESLSSEWGEEEPSSISWRYFGWALAEAYFNLGDYSRAFEVGQKLKDSGFNSVEFQKKLVVAAYRADQVEAAKELLVDLDALESETKVVERLPASSEKEANDLEEQLQKISEVLRASASSSAPDDKEEEKDL